MANLSFETMSTTTNSTETTVAAAACTMTYQMTVGGVLQILSVPLLFFGFISNVVCIVVFIKKMEKTSTIISLTTLSISDGIHCVCFLPYALNIYRYTGTLSFVYKSAVPFIKFVTQALIHVMRTYSIYMMALLSLERLVAIASPTNFPIWFNKRRAMVYNGIILLLALCLIAPKLSLDVAIEVYSPCLNDIVLTTVTRPGFKWFTNFYYGPFQSVFITVLPLCVIIPCNFAMIIILRMQRHRLNQELNDNDKQILKLVLVLVAFSTTCFITSSILPTVALYTDVPAQMYRNLIVSKHFVNVMNAATNLVIYFTLGPRFRKALKMLCGRNNRVTNTGGASSTAPTA